MSGNVPLDGTVSVGVYIAAMESLSTAEATRKLGLPNVARFFRLADKHGIEPLLSAPGVRGAKFWAPDDVHRLGELLAEESVA